jgi:hypothetical protein
MKNFFARKREEEEEAEEEVCGHTARVIQNTLRRRSLVEKRKRAGVSRINQLREVKGRLQVVGFADNISDNHDSKPAKCRKMKGHAKPFWGQVINYIMK